MTTLVTGATGFLGSALVSELVKRREQVRILARNKQQARQIFADAVTIVPEEITDTAQVQRAVDGATTIYHLAGRLYSYNIAGKRPVTIRELATAIVHALGKTLPWGSIPLWFANLASGIFAKTPGMRGEHAPLTRSVVQKAWLSGRLI